MLEPITASITLQNETATLELGGQLSKLLTPGFVIFLEGNLGAGKTTFVRGFLKGCAFQGPVKSPTYTLVEEYEFDWGNVYHFDLYRITDPEELEYMGVREYFNNNAILFFEWAERGVGILPAPDLELIFSFEQQEEQQDKKDQEQQQEQNNYRNVILKSGTEKGQKVLRALQAQKN